MYLKFESGIIIEFVILNIAINDCEYKVRIFFLKMVKLFCILKICEIDKILWIWSYMTYYKGNFNIGLMKNSLILKIPFWDE